LPVTVLPVAVFFFGWSHKRRWNSPSRRSPSAGEIQIILIFTVMPVTGKVTATVFYVTEA
jgi:hypothetical protein